MSTRERDLLESAKRQGCLLTRTCSDELRFAYRDWCHEQRLPFMMIRQGAAYARIELNLETSGRVLTKDAEAAFYNYLNQKTAGSARPWRSMSGKRSCDWEYIPAAHAEEIGRELLRLAIENSGPEPPGELSWLHGESYGSTNKNR